MKAVHLESYGGPEVLRLIDVETPAAGPGQIVVRNKAIGFNYLETRQRRGDYPLPIPGGIGAEAAGIVESVGSGVSAFSPGERVAYVSARPGADAEAMAVEVDRAFILPASVSFEAAAASIIKGMTAEVLLKRTYPVKPGSTILVWSGQRQAAWGSISCDGQASWAPGSSPLSAPKQRYRWSGHSEQSMFWYRHATTSPSACGN
jgi:NADPH2:quinone reductase